MLPAPYRSRLFLGKKLPPEVQSIIIEHLEVAKVLLKEPDVVPSDGVCPAAANGHAHVVKFLLGLGRFTLSSGDSYKAIKDADFQRGNRNYLHVAAENGCIDMVKFLLEVGDIRESSLVDAINVAIKRGDVAMLKLFRESKEEVLRVAADLSIISAASLGQLEMVEFFMSLNSFSSCIGLRAAVEAAKNGCTRVVKKLMTVDGLRPSTSFRRLTTATETSPSHPDTNPSASEGTIQLRKTQSHLLPLYPQPPPIFVAGNRCTLYDSDNRPYLDMNSGIAVNALGHAHPAVLSAIKSQSEKIIHVSNLYRNENAGQLADSIVAGLQQGYGDSDTAASKYWSDAKVFFCNSGTEANEAAIKFARKHARACGRVDPVTDGTESHPPYHILSFSSAFHGRTMGALSATPSPKYQKPFYPLVPGFITSTYNDVKALDAIPWERIAGVIVEPVQGEGGVFVGQDEFLGEIRKRCDAVGAVLIFDEIQCGLSRTGHLFAHHATTAPHTRPDIISLAKPLANGIPIGATLVTSCVAKSITPGDHGTTFGGNPFATGVAQAVWNELSAPSFQSHVKNVSERLRGRLDEIVSSRKKSDGTFGSVIAGPVRGRGLLLGLPLRDGVKGAEASKFVDLCRELGGVLVISAGANT
ncbi:acetylornithine aminotransferase, partial [Blyttiomyces sp. JEL0837]